MTPDHAAVDAILRTADETLKTAQMGLKDLRGEDPARRLPGLRNAIVFGRAVTNVIENLRSKFDNFDDWYKPQSAVLSDDGTFRQLYKMRSEILKQGKLNIRNSLYIEHLNPADLQPLLSNPPPGAGSFFIGDPNGGSGWEVRLPSGDTEKYYVALPASIGMTFSFDIQTPYGYDDAAQVVERYLDAMSQILAEAKSRFLVGR